MSKLSRDDKITFAVLAFYFGMALVALTFWVIIGWALIKLAMWVIFTL